jgi:ribosome-binding protein aMBF1 (putative translation factor)
MKDITNYRQNQQEDFFENVQDLALDFGDQIEQARKSHGHTRKELANMLNIKKSHLKNIEYQKTQPNVDEQKKLESTLHIDLTVEDIDY